MSVRLPAIAPQPKPTPQERNAALLQGVISAIMQPPKSGRGQAENSPVDQMMRTARVQSLVNDLRSMPGDAGLDDSMRAYHAIGAAGAAAGGLPFDQMRRSENIEDWRDRPPVALTLENATTVDDVARVQLEAMRRGQPLPNEAVNRAIREVVRSRVAGYLSSEPLPAVTDNPLAAALGYNDAEQFRPAPEPYTDDPAEIMERMRRRLETQ